MLTKSDREQYRTAQFENLLNAGYTRETYKTVDFFTIFENNRYFVKAYQKRQTGRQTTNNPKEKQTTGFKVMFEATI